MAWKFKIENEDDRNKVYLEVCRQVQKSVEGNNFRDILYSQYNDRLEGLNDSPGTNEVWQNSSDVTHPVVAIAHLTVISNISTAVQREQLVLVQAIDPDDEKDAVLLEQFIMAITGQNDLQTILTDMVYNCGRWPVGVAYTGWKTPSKKIRKTLYYTKNETDPLNYLEEDETENFEEYHEENVEDIEYESLPDIRVLNSYDFYGWVPNFSTIEKAIGCGHRILFSENELVRAIKDLDLDEEAVYRLIKKGPEVNLQTNPAQERIDQSTGRELTTGEDRPYELFIWFTKFPMLKNDEGDYIFEEEYLDDDFMVILAPNQQEVLRFDFSPYDERPYEPFYFLPRPGNFEGRCLPEQLDSLAAELTAMLRFGMDTMNLQVSGAHIVKKGSAAEYESWQVYPGNKIATENPKEDIIPLVMPQTSPHVFQVEQGLMGLAEQIYGGQNNQLPRKVQKTAQIEATQLAIGSKYNLYAGWFMKSVVRLIQRMIVLYAKNMPDEGMEFLDSMEQRQRITPIQLKKKFQLLPVITAYASTPEQQMQIEAQKAQVADQYNQKVALHQVNPAAMSTELLKRYYASARRILQAMNEHNVKELIGEEPEENPQKDMLAKVMAQVVQQQGQQKQQPAQQQPQNGVMG